MSENKFWDKLVECDNITVTENGDKAYKSSLNGLMDLMFKGPLKKDPTEDIDNLITLFNYAYNENPLYAIRLLFYIRDVRGGQGCRNFFREIMVYLATFRPALAKELIKYIPTYGSWKDVIYILSKHDSIDKRVIDEIIVFICAQIESDLENISKNNSISLLFKWLPSENTSSKNTKATGKFLRKKLGFTPKEYRKMLSMGRNYLNIVERNICGNKFEKIDYSQVPSLAMSKYSNLFKAKDTNRFTEYLDNLTTVKTKVNASTLYPYDIIKSLDNTDEKLSNAQWNALPDFFAGKFDNSIVVADVSGSMYGIPMDVCISLAIYIAERNTGSFHNKFITFSEHPALQNITGKTIIEKCHNLERADWNMNTNLNAVFKLLYNATTPETVSDMPSCIYIISDMQFDECCNSSGFSTFEKWQKKFKEELNVDLPKIIFWNVSNSYNTVPITINDNGVLLVSGFSPSILKFIMSGNYNDTLSLIKSIVFSERYNSILDESTVNLF
jgi:hypothetical protein